MLILCIVLILMIVFLISSFLYILQKMDDKINKLEGSIIELQTSLNTAEQSSIDYRYIMGGIAIIVCGIIVWYALGKAGSSGGDSGTTGIVEIMGNSSDALRDQSHAESKVIVDLIGSSTSTVCLNIKNVQEVIVDLIDKQFVNINTNLQQIVNHIFLIEPETPISTTVETSGKVEEVLESTLINISSLPVPEVIGLMDSFL